MPHSPFSDMLELRTSADAFERIEAWLRERGFFGPGGEDLVADLFLGYGLSSGLRRGVGALPAEPCPALPLAACAVRPRSSAPRGITGDVVIGPWTRTWTPDEYAGAVERV